MNKKISKVGVILTVLFLGLMIQGTAFGGGWWSNTRNLYSVTLPAGAGTYNFQIHDYIRMDGERGEILDGPDEGTIFSEGLISPLPAPGTRIRFTLPSDYYSGSRWNAQRLPDFVNLVTANFRARNAANPTSRIYRTTIDDKAYNLSGIGNLDPPNVTNYVNGSFYNCSGPSTRDQTCTYGGGAGCFGFGFGNGSYRLTVRSVYSTVPSTERIESTRDESIGTIPSIRFNFFDLVTHPSGCSNFKQCSDGTDNDGDGLIDMLDPGCTDPDGDTEVNVYACSDGIDNDGDGKVDFDGGGLPAGPDPGCVDANDNDETDIPSAVIIPNPIITGPTAGNLGIQYTFSARSETFEFQADGVTPTSQRVRYGFDWNNDAIVDFWTSWVQQGQSNSASFTWASLGSKTFGVKTQDFDRAESNWGYHAINISNNGSAVCIEGDIWTTCSATCGGGTRSLIHVDDSCATSIIETETCNIQACGTVIIEVPPGG